MSHKLTLIRHAALEDNLNGCYVGRLDVPLSKKGKEQAVRLANRLQHAGIKALWSSPALRARETAKVLAEYLKLDFSTMQNLQEIHFGRWEGLTFAQIIAEDPQLVNEWAEMKEDFSFPEGEPHRDFLHRVNMVARQIAENEHDHLAIITHGGVIRTLICNLLDWTEKAYFKIEIQRGGFATLDLHSDGTVLTGLYND